MKRPKRLQAGDWVGVVAPASRQDRELMERGVDVLRSYGLRPVVAEQEGSVTGFAEMDERQTDAVNTFIRQPEIAAIFCAGGGSGAARMTPAIDYPALAEQPKIFWGMEDCTSIHTAIHTYSESTTFYGANVIDLAKADATSLTHRMLHQLFEPREVYYSEELSSLITYQTGQAEGLLVGGHIQALASSVGTKFSVQAKRNLLLLEGSALSVQEVDRAFLQLHQSGLLHDVAGIIIGELGRVSDREVIQQVCRYYAKQVQVPVVGGFLMGNATQNVAVPLGAKARLDGEEKVLRILPGVE